MQFGTGTTGHSLLLQQQSERGGHTNDDMYVSTYECMCLCVCMFLHVAIDNVVDMEMEEDLDILMTTLGVCMYTINLNGVKLSDPTLHLHEVTENGMVCVYIHKWSPHQTGKTYVCMGTVCVPTPSITYAWGQYVFPHPALLMYGTVCVPTPSITYVWDSMCSHTQHHICMGQYVFPHPALLMYGTVCVPTPSITYVWGQYVFPHPALLMYGDSMCSHTQHYLLHVCVLACHESGTCFTNLLRR